MPSMKHTADSPTDPASLHLSLEEEQALRKQKLTGIAAGIGAYFLWGVLTIYWKAVDHIPATEILAHRIIWSLLFLILLTVVTRSTRSLVEDICYIFSHPKIIASVTLASILISFNWIIFIWSVANDRIVEVSLGYYINPLLNVLLGVLFFKEKLTRTQLTAVALAFTGVFIMTFSVGTVPYLAFLLALSFGLYGLVKKHNALGAMTSLTIETMLLTPIALVFLLSVNSSFASAVHLSDPVTFMLLAGSGVVTALPLLLFGIGANRIPFSLLGFLQYLAPTMMLVLGVYLYGEPFTLAHFVSFATIWAGLLLFSVPTLWKNHRS